MDWVSWVYTADSFLSPSDYSDQFTELKDMRNNASQYTRRCTSRRELYAEYGFEEFTPALWKFLMAFV